MHNLSHRLFKNLIWIRFKRIEVSCLYVYPTNFILKISHTIYFYISHWYESLRYKKASENPKKLKWYRGMIKSVTQHSYFEKPNKQMGKLQNNPSIEWVHPKSTLTPPLAWGNKKSRHFSACWAFPMAAWNFYFQNCWSPFLAWARVIYCSFDFEPIKLTSSKVACLLVQLPKH
jgi:hypothetical protein